MEKVFDGCAARSDAVTTAQAIQRLRAEVERMEQPAPTALNLQALATRFWASRKQAAHPKNDKEKAIGN